MQRIRFIVVLVVFVIALALQTIPVQAYPTGSWTRLYEGMDFNTGQTAPPIVMKAYATRVDLLNPYVQMYVSHDNGGLANEVTRQTTPAFIADHGLKAAINANFFDMSNTNTNVFGLVISNGTTVSPAEANYGNQLHITSANAASIVGYGTSTSGVNTAVAGFYPGNDDTVRSARTSVGLSSDGRYLIMVVVDGGDGSVGATFLAMQEWMRSFGAADGAINLDGGGSTTMTIEGLGTLNHPTDGSPRAVGANLGVNSVSFVNPHYLFDSHTMAWVSGTNASTVAWYSGSIYWDQTGGDCNIFSPYTDFGPSSAPQMMSVDVYPENGSTASHDMQLFWRTVAEPGWDAAKSTPIASYTAQNSWATVNLPVNNAKWQGQVVRQLRLDVDNVNHGNRWFVNHIVKQNALWWSFDSNTMGWGGSKNSLGPISWIDNGYGGIYMDQTGDDAYMFGPGIPCNGDFPYYYIGGCNDRLHVRVYPQNGNTANHDMRVYWVRVGDGTWNDAKSVGVSYTGQNQWVDVYLPVGGSSDWAGKNITQIRLDFDAVNHGNRWIVDYITTGY